MSEHKYLIKVHLPHRLVSQNIEISAFPCTLGRSMKNSIIIDAESVSSEHCKIELNDDGSLLVTDLNSTNGILFDNNVVSTFTLHESGTFFIGDVRVDVLISEEVLEKTKQIDIRNFRKETQENFKIPSLVIIAVYLLVNLLEFFVFQYIDKQAVISFAIKALSVLVAAATIVLFFAGISKLASERFQFFRLFFYFMSFFTFIEVIEAFDVFAEFIWESRTFTLTINILYGILSAGFFYFFATIVFAKFRKTTVAKVYVMSLLLLSFVLYGKTILLNDFSVQNIDLLLRGAWTNPAKGKALQGAFTEMDGIFRQVDEYRDEVLQAPELAEHAP